MELTIQESNELEGTGGVIVQSREPFSLRENQALRLAYRGRECGGLLRAAQTGSDMALVDKHLRLHLRARAGERVNVEVMACPKASAATFSAPAVWATAEGGSILRGMLLGRPLALGQKLPVFTFSGAVVLVTVTDLLPGAICLLGDETQVEVKAQGQEETGESAITYRDIGGMGRELRRVRELVEFPLRSPEVFAQLGIEAPRGIIFHGPPGTGKTLIARALSNEVGAQIFAIQGPEIVSSYYGESERQLREMFEKARQAPPALILIDELDALAPRREQTRGELEQRLVATLLTMMDGLTSLKGVVVIGTTNRINSIDPALRRPGRFEHEIHVGPPDLNGRRDILEIHTRRMPLAPDVDLHLLAGKAPGFVGADLAALCREAGYAAIRTHLPPEQLESGMLNVPAGLQVSAADFQQALSAVRPSALREVMVQIPTEITWDKIGGLEEVKQLIIENVVYGIQRRAAFQRAGIHPARGLLLYGPPGTGKTLLAKAAANECGANFIAVRGPEIHSRWFGESEEKLRSIFARAREAAPTVIFLDEIDALAPLRSSDAGQPGVSIVNQLLVEMDGIESNDNIFVIAATNFAERLDPALLRPGRFDLQVFVPLPECKDRERIFRVHLGNMPLAEEVRLDELARQTENFSGADIAEVCRLAATLALRAVNFEPGEIFQVNEDDFARAIREVQRTFQRLKPRRIGFIPPEEKGQG